VVAMVRQDLGVVAFVNLKSLNRLMYEGNAISGACLAIDEDNADEIYRDIKKRLRIVSANSRSKEMKNYHRSVDETLLFWTYIATIFAIIIAVGVVYNSAR